MSYSTSDLVIFFTAVATLATVLVLVWQTNNAKKTTRAEFTLRLHNDFFFNSRNEKIVRLIDSSQPILKINGGQFVELDLDDFLGIIELLWIYINDGVLTKKTVKDMFGYFIVKTWQTGEIQSYVRQVRLDEKDDSYYIGLENLAIEFNEK